MITSTEPAEAALAATGETPQVADAITAPKPTLQELLPEVHALAVKAGGLDQLAQLIATLRTSKE
jgi:hypothetical protein